MERVYDAIRKEGAYLFCCSCSFQVDSYNFGSILRISPKVEYEEDTTIFGKGFGEYSLTPAPRMQFLAVELGRNRLKLNDWIHEEYKKKQENAKS